MSDTVAIDLSGVRLRIRGLSDLSASQLRAYWSAFLTADPRAPLLDLHVEILDRAPPSGAFDPKAMRSEFSDLAAQYAMDEGEARVEADGRGTIRLARDLGRREYWTVANLLRACLAWRLVRCGKALVHAAGLIVDGRAFLLVGSEGSGKSTWARLGEQAGGKVLSDDLVLVDAAADPPCALGAPFRSTHVTDYRPGSWPIAALLFPRHGAPASWKPTQRILAQAHVLANLPFVADDQGGSDPAGSLVRRLTSAVPCLELTFCRDPGFMPLLRTGPT